MARISSLGSGAEGRALDQDPEFRNLLKKFPFLWESIKIHHQKIEIRAHSEEVQDLKKVLYRDPSEIQDWFIQMIRLV